MDLDDKGLAFPLRLGRGSGLDVLAIEDSVRAMLEQILFTSPGERVNRPTFGVGVEEAVFEPNSPLLAHRIRVALDENVYEFLGKNVEILHVGVDQDEAELHIRVTFQIVGTVTGRQDVEVTLPLGSAR